MENLNAINHLFVESNHRCQKPGCENFCIIIEVLSGSRFCLEHAPRLWVENALRNDKRIAYEFKSTPSACVAW